MRLTLYHFDHCPYCVKVQRAIDRLGIRSKIEFRNTLENPSHASELRNLTGRNQVSCLVIDGSPMLESDDIVSFLESEFNKAV